jgi:hypothetical protein
VSNNPVEKKREGLLDGGRQVFYVEVLRELLVFHGYFRL